MSNNVWFTSDHHFGHGRIVGYCDRPWWRAALPRELEPGHTLAKVARHVGDAYFDAGYRVPDVKAMEEALVGRWNERVAPRDTVYHLGDFAWWHLPVEEVRRIRARLNGDIVLVRGNHDQNPDTKELTPAITAVFGGASHTRTIDVGMPIVLYHYGPHSWGKSVAAKRKHSRRVEAAIEELGRQPALFLHGHSHCSGGVVVRPKGFGSTPTVDMGVEGWNYTPASLDEILARVAAEKRGTVFG